MRTPLATLRDLVLNQQGEIGYDIPALFEDRAYSFLYTYKYGQARLAFLIADDRAPTELIDTLRRLDYFIIGTPPHAPAGGDTWALWLPKDESERRTRGSGFGLHLVGPSGRDRIASMVVHARYLAQHPEEARAYSTAKRHAALRQAPDAENYRAYVEGKAAFIVDQKARAEEWHASVHGPVDLERDYPLFGGTARAKATASTPTPAAT